MNIPESKDYAAITSVEQLSRLADRMLEEGKPIGFDTETGYHGSDFARRSLDHDSPHQFCVGFSFTNDAGWARYVPLAHDLGENIDGGPAAAWEAVAPMLTKGHIVSFHKKFEQAVVDKAAGIKLGAEGRVDDPMLGAYVLGEYYNKSWRTIVGLKELVGELYNHQMMRIQQLWPDLPANKEKFMRFNSLENTPEVTAYACEDALFMIPLEKDICIPAQQQNPFMYTLEHLISSMMYEVERYGVTVDWDAITESYAHVQTFLPNMEQYVKEGLGELAGRDLTDLNLNSAPQKKKLLFHDIGFTTTAYTGKGQDKGAEMEDWERMSTSKDSLEGLSKEYPAVRSLLEYGEVQNLSRRLKKWLAEYTHAHDKKVHASYNQVTVPSGRFAANEPAIQQLPSFPQEWILGDEKEGENGDKYLKVWFRNFIVAAPDHYLLTFDFSQAELRILAGASQEPTLLQAFETGHDVHTATAAMMFHVDPDTIDKELRKRGKTINFAILYGQGPKALGEQIGVDFNEAKQLYKQYFSALSGVNTWYNAAKRKGFENGYTKTIFGRKVPIWELLAEVPAIRAKGERVIINSEIQGGVADYVKFVMLQAKKALDKEGLWNNGVMMTMNQHDALTFEVHNSIDPNRVREILQPVIVLDNSKYKALQGYPEFVADWEIGQKWGSSDKWPLDKEAVFEDGFWIVKPEPALILWSFNPDPVPTLTRFKNFIAEMKELTEGDTKVVLSFPDGEVEIPFTRRITDSDIEALLKTLNGGRIES